jgi:hypothetical protein
MAEIPLYPLYSSTYHLYRLSPLYNGASDLLQERTLRTHARRLKELLKGDSVRGVQVNVAGADNALNAAGPLEDCRWDLLGDEDAWIVKHGQAAAEPENSQLSAAVDPAEARGIHIELQYAETSYSALLFRGPGTTSTLPKFTSLPLLLVRMPAAIREIFFKYLSTAFDTRVAPLKLSSSFLTGALESYFRHLTDDSSTQTIKEVIQQLQLQLTFPTTTTLLKHIDITIGREDVPGFVSQGKAVQKASNRSPFTAALTEYLKKHMAIDLSNPKIQISRIACGAFLLGSDGRIKLIPPAPLPSDVSSSEASTPADSSAAEQATHELYSALVREASGTARFLPAEILDDLNASTPDSTSSQRRARRKRGSGALEPASKRQKGKEKVGTRERNTSEAANEAQTPGSLGIPAEPPPPYELHDPSLSAVSTAVTT